MNKSEGKNAFVRGYYIVEHPQRTSVWDHPTRIIYRDILTNPPFTVLVAPRALSCAETRLQNFPKKALTPY
jgi:hypothetical protein